MADVLQVLDATDATGRTFRGLGSYSFVDIQDHAGGTWMLQGRVVGGSAAWNDISDMTFDGNASRLAYLAAGKEYRLTGGTVGATGYLVPVVADPEINS